MVSLFNIQKVYFNRDYEPYARTRDNAILTFLQTKGIEVHDLKDQVIFEAGEVLKQDHSPYTIFTPYKNKWLEKLHQIGPSSIISHPTPDHFHRCNFIFPVADQLGFKESAIRVPGYRLSNLKAYAVSRNLPAADNTSLLGPHLRFGTVSIREIYRLSMGYPVFQSELIWREFFMQILFHFPEVVHRSFRIAYEAIPWRNDPEEFERWRSGTTGFPMVDAGMRQLNATGFMHNRVRMVTASFLCKHLLIDWRWGEAWFAEKLLDYELASNNGNWQWAAGTGCDAAPYFRVFNPITQQEKFDPDLEYIRKWIPEFGSAAYPSPMVDHKTARERAIRVYKEGLLPKGG